MQPGADSPLFRILPRPIEQHSLEPNMKHVYLVCLFALLSGALITPKAVAQDEQPVANETSVALTRLLARDIFELNSIPFLEPLVIAANASTNAGFFRNAWIPKEDTLYFRFSVVGMGGLVGDNRQYYNPNLPTDTTGVASSGEAIDAIYAQLLLIFQRGIETDNINLPDQAATIFGPTERAVFDIPTEYLLEEIRKNAIYVILPQAAKDNIDAAIESLPEQQTLPGGADMSVIAAAVPQLEIGALWGTELLLRYIPPVRFDDNVGDITFFGAAVRHSISQYFGDAPPFDLAIQGAYQTTSIENTIGVTEAKLQADADIFNVNIHASKTWDGFTAYSGLSFERIEVNTDYTYALPFETQIALNLLKETGPGQYEVVLPDYPGDTAPQTSSVTLEDNNLKFIAGMMYTFDPVSIFVDYSFSEFNIISGGLMVSF